MNKICKQCGLLLDLNCFHVAKYGKFGRSSKCKKCFHENYLLKSNRKHQDDKTKQCTKCLKVKLRSEFHYSKKDRGWLKPECKECRSQENFNPLSNRHTSPEKRRENSLKRKRSWYKKWMSIDPDKFRIYGEKRRSLKIGAKGSFTKTQWLDKFKYYGYRCVYCLRELDIKNVTKDHRIPLSKGGTNWIANIAPACHYCNSGKCDSLHYESPLRATS